MLSPMCQEDKDGDSGEVRVWRFSYDLEAWDEEDEYPWYEHVAYFGLGFGGGFIVFYVRVVGREWDGEKDVSEF